MDVMNRGVIVIKPKAPFVDWVNSTDDTGVVITLDEARQDCTAYLIPEVKDDDELQDFLARNYPFLFEHEFIAWVKDEDVWPTNQDFRTFLEWFDVDFHSVVLDLAEGSPLVLEDETEIG